MNRISMRRASAYAGVLVATLALAPSAFAHAELFPNEIPSGDGYLLNLDRAQREGKRVHDADPDHDAGRLRSRARRSPCPAGPRPSPARRWSNGEMEGGNSITWKGKLERHRARRAAVHRRAQEGPGVRLHGAPDLLGRQRRRCGRATRARTRPPRTSRRRPRRAARAAARTRARRSRSSRSSSAASGCSSAAPGSSRGGARHEDRRAGGHAARRSDGCAGAAGGGVGTRLAARDATAGERRALPTANPGATHLQRAHRAALRGHLGH